ncbi:MAG: glycosyltransferase family 1 [Rariglobus sp.]|jgi:hypothetical protein|nr:glycosyltransferase family 1 [Rariglobus sp.]
MIPHPAPSALTSAPRIVSTTIHRPFRKKALSRPILGCVAVLSLTASSHAADFTFTNTTASPSQGWNSSNWSPVGGGANTAPTLENNYIVENKRVVSTVLSTSAAASTVFAGGTLTLNGQLNLRAPAANGTSEANIVLNSGGVIVNAVGGSTQFLNGTLAVGSGLAVVKSTGSTGAGTGDVRNITFNSLISGGADATLQFLRNGTFTVANTNNTFAGTWKVGGSASVTIDNSVNPTTVSNGSAAVISTLKATGAGSLGDNASVTLDAWSKFDAGFDWTTTGSLSVATNAIVILNQDTNITVGSLSFNGVAATGLIAGNEYTSAQLSTLGYGAYFEGAGIGNGTITIAAIPEPSTYAMILGGLALGSSLYVRRRQNL